MQESLYFLPIGGTAMAPLAGLLREVGHRVSGVDSQLYPPMSTLLDRLAIPVRLGFDPDRMPVDCDRVIIGNAVPRDNPEVAAVLSRGLPHLSQAEAVAHYVLALGLDSLVVAGTHGKTTTSAMLAWILEDQGRDPWYLIGGMPSWRDRPYRRGRGRQIVIEGDEYNAAFFDRGPKFLHYRPHLFVLGPVEFDHADIYRDLEAVITAFRAGAAQVPKRGAVVASLFSEGTTAALRDVAAPAVTVGPGPDAEFRISDRMISRRGVRLPLRVPLAGEHNRHNAAMAVAAAVTVGVALEQAVASMSRFPGVVRRQQVVGEVADVIVVDDFAHHPTALAATIAAARERWPGRRLVVAFEPRSLTAARRSFQSDYLKALAGADLVMVAVPFHRHRLRPAEALDRQRLSRDLAERGTETLMPAEGEDPVLLLAGRLQPGDVVVGCSSGSFDDFHRRLLRHLEAR